MKEILIRKDHQLIKSEKDALQDMQKSGQIVYDAFKELGIEITIADIKDFLHNQNNAEPNFVHDFIADKMIDKAGNPDFNGVPIKRETLRSMIEVPKSDHITNALKNLQFEWRKNQQFPKVFNAERLQIKDGKIVPVDGIFEQIESLHTHYTRTKRGREVAEKLFEHLKRAKELSEFLGKKKDGELFLPFDQINIPGLIVHQMDLPKEKHRHVRNGANLCLITKGYKEHTLDLSFIRQQEELNK